MRRNGNVKSIAEFACKFRVDLKRPKSVPQRVFFFLDNLREKLALLNQSHKSVLFAFSIDFRPQFRDSSGNTRDRRKFGAVDIGILCLLEDFSISRCGRTARGNKLRDLLAPRVFECCVPI